MTVKKVTLLILITALHIFYDTAATRPAFERETGSSWRPAG